MKQSMRRITVDILLVMLTGVLLLKLDELLMLLVLMRMEKMMLYVIVKMMVVNAVRLTGQVAQRVRFS